VLTSAQIVQRACEISKAPGFTQQGGQYLNLTLQDLVLHRDLKMLRQQETINITVGSNGPFLLPANYLRTYDLFFTVNNFPYFLYPLSQEQYDQLFKDPSIANYPYAYTTDLTATQTPNAQGSLFIFPQSTTALALTHRYMVSMPDISVPELSSATPWFQDQNYLIMATAMRIMQSTDDARFEQFRNDCEGLLRTHIIMEGDEQKVVKEIRLDPQRFHTNRTLRPTKLNPY
jgi:hypothetical protein